MWLLAALESVRLLGYNDPHVYWAQKARIPVMDSKEQGEGNKRVTRLILIAPPANG